MSLPNPIVLLDARARYVHPAFAVSRASVKNIIDGGGRMREAPSGAIGWDRRGLLLEPARTNLFANSQLLGSGSGWSRYQISVSADAAEAPDGTMTMSKLVENTNTGTHVLHQTLSSPSIAGDVACLSIFARPGERTMMRLSLNDGSANWVRVVFDVAAGQRLGVSASGGTLVDADIEPLGDGLYRPWIAAALPDLSSVKVEYELMRDGSASYPGDGQSGLFVWGAQFEEGCFPSSLIRTTGATATRPTDQITFPAIASTSWWRQQHGTVVLEFDNLGQQEGATELLGLLGLLRLRYAPNGRFRLESNAADAWPTLLEPNEAADRRRRRVAFSWGDGTLAGVVDGASPVTTGLLSGQSVTNLRLGGDVGSALRRAVYYPQRLSNAVLQSLTAIQE